MKRAPRSEPVIIDTRRHTIGDHTANAIPGYTGYVPGWRSEADLHGKGPSQTTDDVRHARSRATFDAQAHRKQRRADTDRLSKTVPAPRAPKHDNRGNFHPAAGDTQHSRIPVEGEEPYHRQSDLGLTSQAHENQGGFGNLRGYGSASRAIVGFTGHIPGKQAENVHANGWSKMTERSVASHLRAVRKGPKEVSLLTQGGTLVATNAADNLAEIPIRNPSYQVRQRGWSGCEWTGMHTDLAGRLPPKNMQEGFGAVPPPPSKGKIHGYTGWVPGRVGESVVGERQCKTNEVSAHLFKKNRMRITQR